MYLSDLDFQESKLVIKELSASEGKQYLFHLHYKLYNLVQHIFLHLGFLGSITSFKGLYIFL